MRAKVAKNSYGHALEERFLKLSETELYLLYMQAKKEEEEERAEKYEIIKTINTAWTKKFDNYFEMLQLFSNPKMYKHKQDLKELDELKVEVDEENFLDEWEKMMKTIPEEYVVEEATSNIEELMNSKDPEIDDVISGWVENSRKYGKGK